MYIAYVERIFMGDVFFKDFDRPSCRIGEQFSVFLGCSKQGGPLHFLKGCQAALFQRRLSHHH